MHLIVYTSEYVGDRDKIDANIRRIVEKAKQKNAEKSITGVMFHHQGRFLQFLEGPEQSLRALMSKIAGDPMHTDIQYLFDEPLEKRGFPDWSMDVFRIPQSSEIKLSYLEMIRDTYRRNFRTRSATLVEIFRGFVNESKEVFRQPSTVA